MLFELDEQAIWFPDPSLAEPDGLLALGGDLKTERLALAYEHGIFPWYSDETPILWYAPHQRFVLFPEELKISKSMRREQKKAPYLVTFNQAFEQVIRACASVPRKGQSGETWITQDMQKAYIALHKEGKVLSVEVWKQEDSRFLCGGLYGVICGIRQQVFCGESMFSIAPNASKHALIALCQQKDFELIDCQIESGHLKSMGARFIDRETYIHLLQA